ncbi:hypothetical protein FNF27_03865 [Cafeteria roenbergensis]|uniref:VWFA domain-containing protein n=1 Tax=Cafeteria roenbergensis TaxID=33653 RepID=A0A5A8EB10_CAFRO|nr:hypothetical protein FNF27_03865 [Cafeteria roenbergensis]
MPTRASLVGFDADADLSSVRLVALLPGGSRDSITTKLMPVRMVKVHVEIHLSVAQVRIVGKFLNPQKTKVDAVLEVPTSIATTVTSASVFLADKRVIDTMVIDMTEMSGLSPEKGMLSALQRYKPREGSSYNPNVFRLPVEGIPANTEVSFEVAYFQDMDFHAGEFALRVPLRFDPPAVVEGGIANLSSVLGLDVDVNTGTPEGAKGSRTSGHHLTITHGAEAMAEAAAASGTVAAGSAIPSRFCLALKEGAPVPNEDFVISYTAWTSRILANALVERVEPDESGGEQGVLSLFLSPPRLDVVGAVFGRSVVFLLDNSGSMHGAALETAKEALKQCLDQLAPSDTFAICIFNSSRTWWGGQAAHFAESGGNAATTPAAAGTVIHPASSAAISAAKSFVSTVSVSGCTDILTPVQQAFSVLGDAPPPAGEVAGEFANPAYAGSSPPLTGGHAGAAPAYPTGFAATPVHPPPGMSYPGAAAAGAPKAGGPPVEHSPGGGTRVPIVFLITDGAVTGDRNIVKFIRDATKRASDAAERVKACGGRPSPATRMFTFGIGRWVNDHFLRMAAQVGRGHYSAALSTSDLAPRILALMERSSHPVLTDLAVGARGVTSFDCFPFPLPDLFCGAPVIVSARYKGAHPSEVFVRGRTAGGEELSWAVPTMWSQNVPVAKVFARRQLDMLIAQHWLLGGEAPSADGSKGSRPSGPEAEQLRERIVALSKQQQVPCPYTTMVGFPTTDSEFASRRKAQAEDEAARKEGRPPPSASKEGGSAAGASGKAKGGMSTGTKVAIAGGAVVALGATVAAGAAIGSAIASGTDVGGMVTGAVAAAGGGLADFGSFAADAASGIGDAVGDCDCQLPCFSCLDMPPVLDSCFGDCGTCFGDALQCVPDTLGQMGAGCSACCSGNLLDGIGGFAGSICENCGACTSGAGECIATGFGTCGSAAGDIFNSCGGAACSGIGSCVEGVAGCAGSLGDCVGGLGDCVGGIGSACEGLGDCASGLSGILG